MKLIVKQLKGGECTVEVQPSAYISEIKQQIAHHLNIPIEEQKLLSRGRTLVDDKTVKSYPTIKDGSKLNLIVKKPESLHEFLVKSFRKTGVSEVEANNTANRFMTVLKQNIYKLSWDDVERLASDILKEKTLKQVPSETEEMAM